jgi:zinc protease
MSEFKFDETIKRLVLANGLTVILKPDYSAAVVSAQLWVGAGSITEAPHDGSGISHYVEHMLFKGTHKRSYQQINEDVHNIGGSMNAYTSFDRTVYYVDCPKEGLVVAMDVLADISLASIFDPAEAAKEKEVILREIDMGKDDPDRQLSQALFSTAYRTHPYRYPVIGVKSVFEQLTAEKLLTYYKNNYIGSNMLLVVVGDIDLEAVEALVDQYFGNAPLIYKALPNFKEEPTQLAYREERSYGPYGIVRGAMAFKVPGLRDAVAPALDILGIVLGGGQSSVLHQKLREEQKLVQSIDASVWNPGSSELLWISYTCDPQKREAVEAAVLKEIGQIGQNGIEKSAIEKAIRQQTVAEINVRKTVQGQAGRLGVAEMVIGDLQYPSVYLKKLQSTSVETVLAALKEYLKPEGLSAISLEPSEAKPSSISNKTNKEAILPDFQETVLSNGTRFLFQPWQKFPKVHLKAVLAGGALYEYPDRYGATALLATLLTKDTCKRNALQVAQIIEEKGGTFREFTGNNTFGLGIEVLPEDVGLAVDLLSEALNAPLFLKEAFETERAAQIALIQEDMDDVVSYAKHHLKKHFFGEHPFHTHVLGSEETLNQLDRSHIQNEWQRLVCGNNLVIAVTGAFNPEEMRTLLEEQFAGLKAGSVKPDWDKVNFKLPASNGFFESILEREQAIVFQSYPDVGITDDTFEVGEVLDELLSGMSSNLFKRVREELGLAYFVGSHRMNGIATGMFSFCAGTHPNAAHQVFDHIQAEIKRLQQGAVTAEELKRCKTRLKAQKKMAFQSLGVRATDAALAVTYGFSANYCRSYEERIDRVTLEDLKQFALRHFDTSKQVRLLVRP